MRPTWIAALALGASLCMVSTGNAQAGGWERKYSPSARTYGYVYGYGPVYGYAPGPNAAPNRTAPIYGYGPGYAPGFGAGYYSPSVNMGSASWWREPRRRR